MILKLNGVCLLAMMKSMLHNFFRIEKYLKGKRRNVKPRIVIVFQEVNIDLPHDKKLKPWLLLKTGTSAMLDSFNM